MSTTEILKALAPEFAALDEAEKKATEGPWKAFDDEDDEYEADKGWVECWDPESKKLRNGGMQTFVFEKTGQKPEDAHFTAEARNQSRALLDAHAQALVKLAEREWMPIETAPRDGRELLLFDEDCVVIGFWNTFGLQEWTYENQARDKFTPTHWQPLPKPPEAKP